MRGEGRLTAGLAGYFFLLVAALYLMKPARNALFISEFGTKNLPYVYVATALVTWWVVIVYIRSTRMARLQAVLSATLAATLICLAGFWYWLGDSEWGGADTGDILMVAYMNEESLALTVQTGNAVYYSRSRQKLWKKGEQSGHMQQVQKILVDCDQDCLVLKVTVESGQCHTGHQSCFYRAVTDGDGKKLEFVAQKVYDPKKAYES